MKIFRKIIVVILSAVMLSGTMPAAFAAGNEVPRQVLSGSVDEAQLDGGVFYVDAGQASLEENGPGVLLRIARSPSEMLPESSVRITMTDITAHFGDDYSVELQGGASEVVNAGRSKAIIDILMENADSLLEYNDTDSLLETGSLSSKNENAELSDEESEAMEAALGQALDGTKKKGEILDDPLREAKSEYAGVKSDRVPMSDGTMSDDTAGNIIEQYSQILDSAYIDLTFEEGVSEKYLSITPKDNNKSDGERLFDLTLSAVSEGAVISAYSGASVSIKDDEPQQKAVIALGKGKYEPEKGFVQIEVTREGNMNQTVSATLSTKEGSAVEGKNYAGVNAVIYFPYGITKRHVNIPVNSTGIDKKADFSVELSEPSGAELGAVSSAVVTISEGDQNFTASPDLVDDGSADDVQDLSGAEDINASNDLPLGTAMRNIENVYNIRTNEGKVSQDTSQNNVRFFADKHGFLYLASSWAGCNLKMDPTGLQKNTFFYEGIHLNGSMCSDADDDDKLKVRVDLKDENGGTKKSQSEVLCKDADTVKADTDVYFGDGITFDNVYVELYRDDEGTRSYNLKYWQPILRPFNVSLVQAEPLKFFNSRGELVDNTRISTLENANQANLADAVKGTAVLHLGEKITVSRVDDSHPVTHITGLDLVNNKKTDRAELISLPGSSEKSITYDLSLDNKDIGRFRDDQQLMEMKTVSRSGKTLYDIDCYVQPVFDYYDSKVKIYDDPDAYGIVKPSNYHKEGVRGEDNIGKYTEYTFHLGDYLRLEEIVSGDHPELRASAITVQTRDGSSWYKSDISLNDDKTDPNYGKAVFQNYSEEVRVFPKFDRRENAVCVRINKNDIDKFRTDYGFLADKTVKASREDSGDSYLYTVVAPDDFVSEKYYDLRCACKNNDEISVWTTRSGDRYAQNTFYYFTGKAAEHNIITLSAEKTSGTPFIVDASLYDKQTEIGGVDSITNPVEEAVMTVWDGVYAISDKEGKAETAPFAACEGCFTMIKAESDGLTTYTRAALSGTPEKCRYKDEKGQEQEALCIKISAGSIVFTGTSYDHPYISNVICEDKHGTVSSYIGIDGEPRTFTVSIADDGKKYYDSDGVEHSENVSAVKLQVFDHITNQKKYELPAVKEDDGTWKATFAFFSGFESQYDSSDHMYVQVTTDRYSGNGKAFIDGEWVEQDALKKTVYAPVLSQLEFTAGARADMKPQDIPIPGVKDISDPESDMESNGSFEFIGNLGAHFKMGLLMIDMTPVEGNRIKLSFGSSIGAIDNIMKKDENGVRQPDLNPDQEKISKFSGGKKILGTTFGVVGGFLDKPKWDVSFGLYVYLKPDPDAEGAYTGDGGGLYAGLNGSWRGAYYFMVLSVPVYFGFDLTGCFLMGGRLDCTGRVDDIDDLMSRNTGMSEVMSVPLETCISVTAEGYAGVGICKVIGARGGFSGTIKFLSDPTINEHKDDDPLDSYQQLPTKGTRLTFSVKVWVDLLIQTFDYSWLLKDVNYGYFEAIKKMDSSMLMSGGSNAGTLHLKEECTEGSEWKGESFYDSNVTNFDDPITSELVSDAYDRADPQLLDMGEDGIILVFVDKNPNGVNELDNTVLKYSILKNGKWSEPVIIQNDNTADFQPNLCDAGEDVMISWVSRDNNSALRYSSDEKTEFLNELDIYSVKLNKKSHELGKIERLTNDDYLNCAPHGVYVPENGDCMVYFQKSEVGMSYMNSYSPTDNNCEITYMLFDGERSEWVRDEYFPNEAANVKDSRKLAEELGGQRFVVSKIPEFDMNDPLQVDFEAAAFGKYVIYAFTVDEDNDYSTGDDRALFVQIYDSKEHKTYDPVRVMKSNKAQSTPEILIRKTGEGNEPLLFWLDDGENVCWTSLIHYIKNVIEGGQEVTAHTFSDGGMYFGSQDQNDNPNLNTYNPCTDADGDLYVTWNQAVYNEDGSLEGQEIFASALIDPDAHGNNDGGSLSGDPDDTGVSNGTAWSNGVQLTHNGKYNDEQVITIDGNNNIIVVNTQMDLDLDADRYDPKNISLVASIQTPVCSLKLKDLEVSDETPSPGDKVTVSGSIADAGLLRAENYTMTVMDQTGAEVYKLDGIGSAISPAGIQPFCFNVTIPEDGTLPELEFVLSAANIRGQVKESYKPFRLEPHYQLTNVSTVHKGADTYLKCTVSNDGNAAAPAGADAYLRAGWNNIFFSNQRIDDDYIKVPADGLGIGESRNYEEKLAIPDSAWNDDITYACANVIRSDGTALSDDSCFTIVREIIPDSINIEGMKEGRITLDAGSALELKTSCSPAEEGTEVEYYYNIDGSDVASVENGVLKAKCEGSADLDVYVMPYGIKFTVPVEVTGAYEPVMPEDVKSDDWFYEDVKVMYQKGLMNGVSEKLFDPQGKVTRGMAVTMLWRLEGRPESEYEMTFKDVKPDIWYTDAIRWASETGVVNGYSKEKFGPDDFIPREQLATMIYRYFKYKYPEAEPGDPSMLTFKDKAEISSYAIESTAWCVENGVINGMPEGRFEPKESATRAQTAAVFNRLLKCL